MATNKQFDTKLLSKKAERFPYFLALEQPISKDEMEQHFIDFGEWFEEAVALVRKISDDDTAQHWTDVCASPLSDVDESNERELWRRFRKSLEASRDWLVVFLSENATVAGSFSHSDSPAEKQQRVFIGHGRSPAWRELKDFLQDTLDLEWEEFNRDVAAGLATTERIAEMLNSASFAFIVMTAEDKHADGSAHARENVVHEAGLFQGRLGFRKAIILIEEGCEEFSNIKGLTHIRFPKNDILARSEEVRRVLKREEILE